MKLSKLLLICAIGMCAENVMAETENKMNFSVGSGVIQGNLKYSEIDVDDKMDGYFINLGLGDRSGIHYFTEYTKQESEHNTQYGAITIGVKQRFYQLQNFYTSAGFALGYVKIKSPERAELASNQVAYNMEYVTVPLSLEAGYVAYQKLSLFAGLDFDIIMCKNEIAVDYDKSSGRNVDMDVLSDHQSLGLKYKVGLRYYF